MLERADLQRLLRDRLDVIVPDAMLLTEEFGEWADKRRLDLLAIDRDAKLVVIELKRTDDARTARDDENGAALVQRAVREVPHSDFEFRPVARRASSGAGRSLLHLG